MAVAKYLKNLFEEEKNEAMSRDEKIFLTKPSQDFKKIAETMLTDIENLVNWETFNIPTYLYENLKAHLH